MFGLLGSKNLFLVLLGVGSENRRVASPKSNLVSPKKVDKNFEVFASAVSGLELGVWVTLLSENVGTIRTVWLQPPPLLSAVWWLPKFTGSRKVMDDAPGPQAIAWAGVVA